MRTEEKELSEETLEVIERLCLFDDDFMSLVFERNIEATEYLINTVLERDDLKVIEVAGQREYKNPYFGGRVVRVDIYAMDADGKVYDIEVQRSDAGAVPERARFHSAMVDVRMLKGKQKFKEIKDSYIIFITQNDVVGKGLPLYHIERMIRETKGEFGDGSHIIYVNGAYKNDEDPIGRLVHDFGCVRPADMYSDLLKEQVRYFKETEGGRTKMCELIENAAEKLAVKMAEKLAEEKAEKLAEEKAEKLAEEKAEKLAEEKAEKLAEEKAEKLAEEKAEKLAEEKAEKLAEEKRRETIADNVKRLTKNAKMTVDAAFDILEVSEKDREMILKVL